jgi:hypothetical protein
VLYVDLLRRRDFGVPQLTLNLFVRDVLVVLNSRVGRGETGGTKHPEFRSSRLLVSKHSRPNLSG